MSRLLPVLLTLFTLLLFNVEFSYGQESREKQLIQSLNSEKNPNKRFSRLMALGEYYKTHDLYKADSIKEIILSASRNYDDSIRFNALFYYAEIAQINGNQEEYFNTILACQPFLNKLKSEEFKFKVYRHLGYYHSNMLEFETSDFYLRMAIKIAGKNKDYVKLSEANRYLALNFMMSNQKDSALFYADKARKTGLKSGDNAILAQSYNTQARIYQFFDQVELSVAKNFLAQRKAEEARSPFLLAKFTRELGESELIILNYADAETYFQRSLSYARQINDRRQIALALTKLASVQLKTNQYSRAASNANQSLEYLTKLNDLNSLGETHNILGMIDQGRQNYDMAASNFNKALVYYESTNNREASAGVYHNVGNVFLKQKKYKKALFWLNRSIEIREQFGAKNQIYNTYRVISDVYRETNDQQKALEYLELYVNYLDSNTTIEAAAKIAELSESYRAAERERLIISQGDSIERQRQERNLTEAKLENVQLRNNFQAYTIIAFIVIIVLAGVIIFYRWNQTQIKQQQQEAEMRQTLLRTQMNPHFVFNAMSVIQSYIFENDTVNSSKFLVNFSRLMRLILENSPKEFIPITTETEILEKYLSMQKLRFQDRFEYIIDCDEMLQDDSAVIPPMITQPFIENAIEHGQLHTIEGGFIRVSFQKEENMLLIRIEDNGIGRKASKENKKSSAHKSMAMTITKDRIDNLNKKYRTDGFMEIEDYNKSLETGTKVLISLPYRVDSNLNS
ncbi:MAG: tetratricopeptide repeat-containing sensor histidine kinase [Crocinitomicaceae bacterium]